MGRAPTSELFFDKISSGVSANDLSRIRSAWVVAKSAHSGQTRQSGEPYDTHPLAVAELVYDFFGADTDCICAAMLHDVVEDSDTPLASIRADFGESVAHIVDGVSKLDSVQTAVSGAVSAKEETLRKLIGAGGRDWRVFAVKLCDRLHNMRTLAAVSRDKQRRVSSETALVYAPLARYVGFQRLASELDALSLRWSFPWRWKVVSKWVAYKRHVDRQRLAPLFKAICRDEPTNASSSEERTLNDEMNRAFVTLRGDRACRAVFSVPTVYEVTSSLEEAYLRTAVLHRHFSCLPGSFVCLPSEGVVTSKILFRRHALVAEFVFLFARIRRDISDLSQDDAVDGDDFAAVASGSDQPGSLTRVLRELVQDTSIAVFSPMGQRFSLPRRASGLDFAFAVHTDLGLRASAIRVNGQLRDARVELSSGDIVEVIASEQVRAAPEWESVLRSPRSRAKLRHWLRESAQDDAAILGRRLLANAAGLDGADDTPLYVEFAKLSAIFGVSSREELWRSIGAGELSAFAVAARLRGSGADQLLRITGVADARSRLLLDGRRLAGIQYCEFCMPVAGDAILAVGSFAGVKIHRSGCLYKNEGRASNDVFAPMWAARIVQPLPAELCVKSVDRNGLLADCARAIADQGINVTAVTTQSTQGASGPVATLAFTVLIRSRAKLESCLKVLGSVRGVLSAVRPEPTARAAARD